MGLIWLLALVFLTSESPANHKFISQAEKEYILENTQKNNSNKNVRFILANFNLKIEFKS